MRTHRELIAAWGERQMAEDLGATYIAVHSWKHRNAIPYHLFPEIVRMAPLAGFSGITLEFLHALHRGPTQNAKSTRSKKNASKREQTPV